MIRHRTRTTLSTVIAMGLLGASTANADPPVPSGTHPRLFMSSSQLATYKTNAATKGTAASDLVAQCDDTFVEPNQYKSRGGSDGNYWPQSAVACAFAYLTTGTAKYLPQALMYWQASLSDDQTIGDGKGCVVGVNTNWQTWASGGENGAVPPVILTVDHDDQYSFRWYAPDVALVYDWLYSAAGASALVKQTQVCLPNWVDFYTGYGYHRAEAGSNYNAGYIIGKALSAIAIGNDGGADGHMWTQVLDNDYGKLLLSQGVSGTDVVGTEAGVMLGGDFGEGWEYGALSVLEYATATSALEVHGASFSPMDQWASALALRDIYAVTPTGKYIYCGNGDCDIPTPNLTPPVNELDAVLVGNSNASAASWALSLKKSQNLSAGNLSAFFYNALAETRVTAAADFTKQNPAPPLWYLARGTRQVYARTSWSDPEAFWGVFMSEPQLNSDHQHFAATNFVFSHGGDDLIVDPSAYGENATLATNAISADATVLSEMQRGYGLSQSPWSQAELLWARSTVDNTVAARGDIMHAFDWADGTFDIKYAHREWVMLPEGEVVLVDRVHTSASNNNMYITLHTNTGGGGLKLANGIYSGTVGSSKVAIHPVLLSGGTPKVFTPAIFNGQCSVACDYPCGVCTDSKYKVDAYTVTVPGDWAVGVHVIDGLAAADTAPTVFSMNDATTIDPGSKDNKNVIGAAVLRGTTQSYVVATSAVDGVSPTTMTYGVPGTTPGRHVVYDAPEASDGTSAVTATASSGRCEVSITAGSGKGFTGHPLIFNVAAASGNCTPTDITNVLPPDEDGGAPVNPDGGSGANPDGGTSNPDGGVSNDPNSGGGGCSCGVASADPAAAIGASIFAGLAAAAALFRRSKRRA